VVVALLGVELMAEPAPPTHGGDDGVGTLNGGTFNGGSGTDQIDTTLDGGTFNGGSGDDFAEAMSDGTFNGGPGDDSVLAMSGGTFAGGGGADDAGAVDCDNVGISIFIWSADYTCIP
jgi:hypothetical protein